MFKDCALYFPLEKLPLKSAFPNGKSNGGLFRSATWFEYESGEGTVRLNLNHENLAEHLRGFRGYIAQLPDNGVARSEAQRLIQLTQAAVGVILPHPASPDSQLFASLMKLIKQFDGFMFVAGSILLPDGSFLIGPMANQSEISDSLPAPSIRSVNPEELRHSGHINEGDALRVSQRENNYLQLAERGFICARWLPLYRTEDHTNKLRPVEEIVARLLALEALFFWVAAPEDVTSSERLLAFVSRNMLRDHLTVEENDILSLQRTEANDTHASIIGWHLENMWALAWILGFEPPPPFFQGQLPQEITNSMLYEFLPDFDATVSGFQAGVTVRSIDEVTQLEDLYYCAHNAVRSAQSGKDTVPQEWHPVRDGGAIHERRHSLTWAVSPGIAWNDTDLST
ncbi:DUF4272 domain-containing protein [Iodobacter sp. HSC-16F04]|uniref:DUF4272 domain-containing protein n=1 Tax=Iodobacter violaceini TaxID=3044271 RepID=A0ABX0KM17_9NEIS|nr:DUF4272 domain-containing protein [Iodobacter violacea]NHQ84632.1 DUF4272 domain-containing protein [Iodobacter violacea]